MNLLSAMLRPARAAGWGSSAYELLTGGSMNFNGVTYPLGGPSTTMGFKQEEIAPGFMGYAYQAMMANPIVFACMEYRRKTFSQAYFSWQRLRNGTPGEFFGTPALGILERPWTNATTPDLLNSAIQHADLGGNAFVVWATDAETGESVLTTLRPDWVTIVAGSKTEYGSAARDATIIGYAYWPGGKGSGSEPELLVPEQVGHFAPTPDPTAKWRGMSWLTPVIREIMADQAATTHKLAFFEHGATPNLVVKLDPAVDLAKFDAWVAKFKAGHEGAAKAYKTIYLGGGADVEAVGANLRQMDFKVTQGAGETRISAAAGVPPVLVGFSEGLASATYSNYASARRSYIDSTLWDLWGNISGALQSILPTPGGSRLWVDSRRIPLLQEDEKDRAEIQQMDAAAISSFVTAGYTPDSAVDAVISGDLSRLEHSGLYSVQLQAPGSEQEPDAEDDARQRLVAAGVARPTAAQVAAALGVSERTLRRRRGRP